MNRYILIHYSEIGLKKANKRYFVDKLRKQIKENLQKKFGISFAVYDVLKRLKVSLPEDISEEEYNDVLSKIFGIKNFQFVYEGAEDINVLANQIYENLPEVAQKAETFCVRVKRSMLMDFTSVQMEREIGALLLSMGLNKKVKLKGPDLEINIEFFSNKGFFSYKKYQGIGGLSYGSGGKLVALLSSGIDSPVAAFQMMKRGARIIFVHFHSYPFSDKDQIDQVNKITEILSAYQLDTKLYLLPFGEVQKAIGTNLEVPGKFRIIMYRRLMVKIAEEIARKEKAKGLVTGDSFGQVASQTLENMFVIHGASKIPLFQPLISFDKEDIVTIARNIGTFEISKLPCKDTCSMFTPKHPETRAKLKEVLDYEKHLPISDFIKEVLEKAEVVYF